jgi:hypothetical protein
VDVGADQWKIAYKMFNYAFQLRMLASNGEFVRVWTEAKMASFKLLSQSLPEGTEGHFETWSLYRDSISGPAEQELGVPSTLT